MKKKPSKVEEPSATYACNPADAPPVNTSAPGEVPVRYASVDDAKKVSDKIFKVHDNLLHRLSQ